MKPRVADDRLLYFTTDARSKVPWILFRKSLSSTKDFVDVGYHQADMHTLPSEVCTRGSRVVHHFEARWPCTRL